MSSSPRTGLQLPEFAGQAFAYASAGVVLLLILSQFQFLRYNKAPLVNAKKMELSWGRVMKEFAFSSRTILSKAVATMNGKPFQVYTPQGTMTVLDPKVINEIRNDERFDFAEHTHRAFNGSLPGFEAFDQRQDMSWFMVQIAQKHLTTYLNQMTTPLSIQCAKTLQQCFTDKSDWHTVDPFDAISRIVAKMSSRIFLGEEFTEDEAWIEASRRYATNAFSAQERLTLWPPILRPVVHWFLKDCQDIRKDVATCRTMIESVLKQRSAKRAAQQKAGGPSDEVQDTLEWMSKVSKGKKFDPTKVQLSLSLAAIHTTTDLVVWLLICLAQHPEVLQPLREEIVSVLKADGWKKTALYNMKLLDSAMKESQRLKPNVLATMRRRAMKDITLSDGTFLPRGTMSLVSSHQMRNPEIYPTPDEFDAFRFYNMRKIPGKENQAQFVTTSPQHMGFSHGQHSCPGRFFAANETKILLCHLLLKYDIKMTEGSPTDSVAFGFALIPNPGARIDIRRRKEELDLSSLET